ncbi:MAG: hypothetical protein HY067_05055 [Betaproteobacteria bacterium]|nr:hypothetical protein [Betaproteobacteria bacterium]
MIRFWDPLLTGAPLLLSFIVRSHMNKWVLTAMLGTSMAGCSSPTQRICDENCAKVKHAVVVIGATMIACGKAFPKDEDKFIDTFFDWRVTKLPIPGLKEALEPNGTEFNQAIREVGKDFQKSPRFEWEVQCAGLAKRLQQQDKMLPADLLAPYEGRS